MGTDDVQPVLTALIGKTTILVFHYVALIDMNVGYCIYKSGDITLDLWLMYLLLLGETNTPQSSKTSIVCSRWGGRHTRVNNFRILQAMKIDQTINGFTTTMKKACYTLFWPASYNIAIS